MKYHPEETMEFPTDLTFDKNQAAIFGLGATTYAIVLGKRLRRIADERSIPIEDLEAITRTLLPMMDDMSEQIHEAYKKKYDS